jgi:hypothetical protein
MLGLGETEDEVPQTMDDLLMAGVSNDRRPVPSTCAIYAG